MTSIMARYYAPQQSEFPFHITARTSNRTAFPIHLDKVWEIFEEELYLSWVKHGTMIHSFVLMPNHFHLIASVNATPIGAVLQDLMRDTSRKINTSSNRINHTWGGRAYRCEIKDLNYFLNAYRYVYQNPLRAELCKATEDWKYSTLPGLLGLQKIVIPMIEDSFLFNPTPSASCLNWLNEEVSREENDLIRKALKRKSWKTPKDQIGRPLISDAPFIRK